MEFIESKENTLIKETKKLREKKYRAEMDSFLVEGFRFVEEALKSDFQVERVFLSENALDKWEKFHLQEKLQQNTEVYCVREGAFKLLCGTETPQGIVAVTKTKKKSLRDQEGFYVLVDKVQDPGNLGTIMRTAHAAGALGVLLMKGTVDAYNEKTLRSTMGAIFNVPLVDGCDAATVQELKKKGFKLVVSSLDTDNNFYDVDLKGKVIIAVGNEGNGISEEIYSLCDEKVKIPMPGNAESLNAGVAASIMMYEVVRQKLSN